MSASKILKRQIVIELVVLVLFLVSLIYCYFAITRSQSDNITTRDGLVIVLDDSNFDKLEVLSDGQGLKQDAISFAITNNNEKDKEYNVVVYPDNHDDRVLKNIKISVDDVYIKSFDELERHNGGYVIATTNLKSGYTKMYSIKLWYQKGMDVSYTDVNFEYELELV